MSSIDAKLIKQIEQKRKNDIYEDKQYLKEFVNKYKPDKLLEYETLPDEEFLCKLFQNTKNNNSMFDFLIKNRCGGLGSKYQQQLFIYQNKGTGKHKNKAGHWVGANEEILDKKGLKTARKNAEEIIKALCELDKYIKSNEFSYSELNKRLNSKQFFSNKMNNATILKYLTLNNSDKFPFFYAKDNIKVIAKNLGIKTKKISEVELLGKINEYRVKNGWENIPFSIAAWNTQKDDNLKGGNNHSVAALENSDKIEYLNKYKDILSKSINIIFHGAPGTGKTYLANEIASYIVSEGKITNKEDLSEDQQQQISFVQFHPSYDYTDFVEGLRPTIGNKGDIGFELQPGSFKSFIDRAIQNKQGNTNGDIVDKYITKAMDIGTVFSMKKGGGFVIEDGDDNKIIVRNIKKENVKKIIKINTIRKLLYSNKEFDNVADIANYLNHSEHNNLWSYYFPIIKELKKKHKGTLVNEEQEKEKEKEKKYVFIIDEINRGEISKIFGELFFLIEKNYRGPKYSVMTQYSNLHDDPYEKLYIPDNVYIIGTMNDIDRSVDSFDFAMRRRFRFINIKADERLDILNGIKDDKTRNEAIEKIKRLNKEIANTCELGINYQIGPSYFLELNDLDNNFDQLWSDYLLPLLEDYVKDYANEAELIDKFEKAYSNKDNSNLDNEQTNN